MTNTKKGYLAGCDYKNVEDFELLYELLHKEYIDLIEYTGYKSNAIELVGCKTLFNIKQICIECPIFKWAYDNKFMPIDSDFNWDNQNISRQELMSFVGKLLAMYDSSMRLISLALKHKEEVKRRQFSCTPSSQDFIIVTNYEEYMPIIKSDSVREVLDDLKSKFVNWLGENYIEREQIVDDIYGVLSTIVIDSNDVVLLKKLKLEIVSYILENSDIPDFSKSFLYAQNSNNRDNNSNLEEGEMVLDDIGDILSTVKFDIKNIALLKQLEEKIKSYILENGIITDNKNGYSLSRDCIDDEGVYVLAKKIK